MGSLQWGRVLTNAETLIRGGDPPRSISFNGAAFLRTRKQEGRGKAVAQKAAASMGPRSYERGNPIRPAPIVEANTLQWGRVLTNAETICSDRPQLAIHQLQWGRVLTNAETRLLSILRVPSTRPLQWGRVLTNAETRSPCTPRRVEG